MSDSSQRGRPVNPLVAQREQMVYAALENPCTSKDVSTALDLSVPAVRLSLKRLREKGSVDLKKVDGVFLWSQRTVE